MLRELGCGKCGSPTGFKLYIDADDSDKYSIRNTNDIDCLVGQFWLLVVECKKCGHKREVVLGSG